MFDFDKIEKLKNPIITFIVGILLGTYSTYIAINKIHEKHILIYETSKLYLEEKITERDLLLKNKDDDISSLNQLIASYKNTIEHIENIGELEKFISKLDAEIKNKKLEMARHSGIAMSIDGEGDKNKKSDSYLILENELQVLEDQRDIARQTLIDNYAN